MDNLGVSTLLYFNHWTSKKMKKNKKEREIKEKGRHECPSGKKGKLATNWTIINKNYSKSY